MIAPQMTMQYPQHRNQPTQATHSNSMSYCRALSYHHKSTTNTTLIIPEYMS